MCISLGTQTSQPKLGHSIPDQTRASTQVAIEGWGGCRDPALRACEGTECTMAAPCDLGPGASMSREGGGLLPGLSYAVGGCA